MHIEVMQTVAFYITIKVILCSTIERQSNSVWPFFGCVRLVCICTVLKFSLRYLSFESKIKSVNESNERTNTTTKWIVITVWVNAIVVYGLCDEHFKNKRFFNRKIDVCLIIIYCSCLSISCATLFACVCRGLKSN